MNFRRRRKYNEFPNTKFPHLINHCSPLNGNTSSCCTKKLVHLRFCFLYPIRLDLYTTRYIAIFLYKCMYNTYTYMYYVFMYILYTIDVLYSYMRVYVLIQCQEGRNENLNSGNTF